MTDAAFITVQICTTAAAIAAGLFSYLASSRAAEAKAAAVETHEAVNSRVTEFLEMAEKTFHAQGVLREKQDEAVRKAEIVIAIGQAASPSIQSPQPATAAVLAKAIEKVPEKTATKVVEKLAEK